MKTIELFHGSTEPVTEIRNDGIFGGIFVTPNRGAAESHGPVVSAFELADSDVLSNYVLNYEITDIDAIRAVLTRECAAGADIDRAWEIVVEDAGCRADDDDTLFACDDDHGWEAQRIRGRVAAALGYRAVEMRDEHGTTYLIVGPP